MNKVNEITTLRDILNTAITLISCWEDSKDKPTKDIKKDVLRWFGEYLDRKAYVDFEGHIHIHIIGSSEEHPVYLPIAIAAFPYLNEG